MTKRYELVLDMALGLSTNERALLTRELLANLPPESLAFSPDVIAEWERRAEAALQNVGDLVDGEDVLTACRQLVRDHVVDQIPS